MRLVRPPASGAPSLVRAGLRLGIASLVWLGSYSECQRKGLHWLELVRVMVRDVTRQTHRTHASGAYGESSAIWEIVTA